MQRLPRQTWAYIEGSGKARHTLQDEELNSERESFDRSNYGEELKTTVAAVTLGRNYNQMGDFKRNFEHEWQPPKERGGDYAQPGRIKEYL